MSSHGFGRAGLRYSPCQRGLAIDRDHIWDARDELAIRLGQQLWQPMPYRREIREPSLPQNGTEEVESLAHHRAGSIGRPVLHSFPLGGSMSTRSSDVAPIHHTRHYESFSRPLYIRGESHAALAVESTESFVHEGKWNDGDLWIREKSCSAFSYWGRCWPVLRSQRPYLALACSIALRNHPASRSPTSPSAVARNPGEPRLIARGMYGWPSPTAIRNHNAARR